jgi:hypothetical protein
MLHSVNFPAPATPEHAGRLVWLPVCFVSHFAAACNAQLRGNHGLLKVNLQFPYLNDDAKLQANDPSFRTSPGFLHHTVFPSPAGTPGMKIGSIPGEG